MSINLSDDNGAVIESFSKANHGLVAGNLIKGESDQYEKFGYSDNPHSLYGIVLSVDADNVIYSGIGRINDFSGFVPTGNGVISIKENTPIGEFLTELPDKESLVVGYYDSSGMGIISTKVGMLEEEDRSFIHIQNAGDFEDVSGQGEVLTFKFDPSGKAVIHSRTESGSDNDLVIQADNVDIKAPVTINGNASYSVTTDMLDIPEAFTSKKYVDDLLAENKESITISHDDGDAILNLNSHTDDKNKWRIVNEGAYHRGAFYIQNKNGGVWDTRMYLNSSGGIGFGAINNNNDFYVKGSSNTPSILRLESQLSYGEIDFKVANGSKDLLLKKASWGVAFYNGGSSGIALSLRTHGKVGINTLNPSGLLDIIPLSGNTDPKAIIMQTGNSKCITEIANADTTLSMGIVSEGNDLSIYTGGGSDNKRITATGSGNVGIGTENPSEMLEVSGGARYVSADLMPDIPEAFTSKQYVDDKTDGVRESITISHDDGEAILNLNSYTENNNDKSKWRIISDDTYYYGMLSIQNKEDESWNTKLYLNSRGGVGIGGINNGYGVLIKGKSGSSSILNLESDIASGEIDFKIKNGAKDLLLKKSLTGVALYNGGNNAAPALSLRTHGRVGINTLNPYGLLDVNAPYDDLSPVALRLKTLGSKCIAYLVNGDTTKSLGLVSEGDDLSIFTSGNSSHKRLTIKEGGNVGIGAVLPTLKLEVNGSAGYSNASDMPDIPEAFASKEYVDSLAGEQESLTIRHDDGSAVLNMKKGTADHANWRIFADETASYGYLSVDDFSGGAWETNLFIKSGGNVGVGTNTPEDRLHVNGGAIVNGFTKLGDDAPAIKHKKLTGTTPNSVATLFGVTHGLDSNKILSVSVHVSHETDKWMGKSYPAIAFEFGYYVGITDIFIRIGDNATSILSKPVKILVTYEE